MVIMAMLLQVKKAIWTMIGVVKDQSSMPGTSCGQLGTDKCAMITGMVIYKSRI